MATLPTELYVFLTFSPHFALSFTTKSNILSSNDAVWRGLSNKQIIQNNRELAEHTRKFKKQGKNERTSKVMLKCLIFYHQA
jgi:hypothetical protein